MVSAFARSQTPASAAVTPMQVYPRLSLGRVTGSVLLLEQEGSSKLALKVNSHN
jgi:hypothetical protein